MSALIANLQQPRDRAALEQHFARLSDVDLRYRFGGTTDAAGVSRYLDSLAQSGAPAFGVYNPDGELVALAQLGVGDGEVEVGLSVLPGYRRHGLASALLNRAASYACSRGIRSLVIVSLADNQPILALARRHGMTVTIAHGEAHGHERLHAATALDFWREVAFDQMALAQSVRRNWQLAAQARGSPASGGSDV